jgi:PAS domain S-box-containing protein
MRTKETSRRIGITQKLAAVFMGIIAVISLFIFLYFPRQFEKQAFKAIVTKAGTTSSMGAFNLGAPLLFEDRLNVQAEIDRLGQDRDLLYAVVVDRHGIVTGSLGYGSAKNSGYQEVDDPKGSRVQGTVFRTKTPILHNGVEIGQLYLGFSLVALKREVADGQRHIASVSLLVFVLGMIMVVTVSKFATKPIQVMLKTVEGITRGDLSNRAPVSSNDEVGELARAFNTMVENLESAYRELERVNQTLEDEVERRTRELFVEVGERKMAEEALKASEIKYRTLFETSIDVVCISTPEGVLLDINPAGIELFGYPSRDELLSINIARDLHVNPLDWEVFKELMEEYGYVNALEVTLKKKDGQRMVISVSSNAVRDPENRIVAYRCILRDITNVKKLEQQLIQSQKLETVGKLTGGIAHDFNNILNVVLGNAHLARLPGCPQEKVQTHLAAIEKAANRAAGFVRQLLAYSSRQVLDLKPVFLNDVVTDFAKMIHRAIGENIEMRFLSPEDLPAISADVSQLNQVLLNLVVNARDAMPGGGELTIETQRRDIDELYCKSNIDAKPGQYVVLSVTDTGVGIAPEVSKRIFEPFFTTKPLGEGTGLGLSVVYGIVRQHGGFISLYSEPGKGTTLKVYFPVTERMVHEETIQDKPVTGGNETILIAEDEESLKEVASTILGHFGYKTILASDGVEAIEVFKDHRDEIDLLLLDVVMPRLGGWETYEKIKAIEPAVPALFVTGYSLNGIHTNFVLERGVDAIQKPYSAETLGRKIREILDRRGKVQ